MTATTCTHLQPPCTHLALAPDTCTHHHPLMGCGVVVVASDGQPPCTHSAVFVASKIRAHIGRPFMLITIRPALNLWQQGQQIAAIRRYISVMLALLPDTFAALSDVCEDDGARQVSLPRWFQIRALNPLWPLDLITRKSRCQAQTPADCSIMKLQAGNQGFPLKFGPHRAYSRATAAIG